MKIFPTDLDSARSKRTKKAKLLEEAKALVAKREATVDQLSNDCAEAVAMEKAVIARDVEAMVVARLKALAETEAEIVAPEQREAEVADAKQRAETAAAITALAADLTKCGEEFTVAMTRLEQAAVRMAGHFGEHHGFAIVMGSLRVEMPLTIAEKVAELTFRAADVIAGRGMATLPEPAKPAPPEPLPAPTTRLHASKHIRWTDDAGVVQTAGAYFDCNLPPAMADYAIKIDAAWSMNDPRRKKSIQSGLGTTQKPSAAVCLDLTALLLGVSSVTFDSQPFSDPRVTEPIMRSPVDPPADFKVTIGKPRQVTDGRRGVS